ncbi:MAG: S41 family peptidase [Verrucomicrobiia bacterium]
MGRFRIITIVLSITACVLNLYSQNVKPPQFKEVYDILKSKLTGIPEPELEAAALNGILNRFSNYVQIVSKENIEESMEAVSNIQFFESNIVCFKIGAVIQTLPNQFADLLNQIQKTNELKGIIIDLRFTSGKNYEAAAKFADLFYSNEKQLFKLGDKIFKTTAKTNAITTPTILLVNKETANAAEALALSLMNCKSVISIGNNTSGTAHSFTEIKLSTGQILRIASASIKYSDDTPVQTNGLKPDIVVDTPIEDERDFIANPYKLPRRLEALESSQTARATRPRLNEAELVRMKKEGIDLSGDLPPVEKSAKPQDSQQKLIQDPSLARAVDILKVINLIGIEKFQK